jgi:hypothetical protein
MYIWVVQRARTVCVQPGCGHGFIWIRTRTSGGLLWTFEFRKGGGSYFTWKESIRRTLPHVVKLSLLMMMMMMTTIIIQFIF